jgi:SAM-dependent methyltransferase
MDRLSAAQDAYGAAVWDEFHGRSGLEINERDDGYINAFGLGPYLAPYVGWPRHERQAIRLARGRVLDIGCGAGRVGLYLQEKGLDVTGIDTSSLAVRVCRERGVKDARWMSVADVGPRLGAFDTIVMYGNNFGLFGSVRQAQRLLRRFHRLTTPEARVLAGSRDPMPRPAPKGASPRSIRCHRAYHQLNIRRGRMPGQIRLRVRYLNCATPYFDYLLASKDQMREVIAGTGWRISRFFDASEGSAYVAVLEKEGQ